MASGAHFSRDRRYRYALSRSWDTTLPTVLFVGLNPSVADESFNDPTITRCINFARDWGYGGVCVANLFAYCATYPTDLRQAQNPVGRGNNQWLQKLSAEAGLTIAAWGNDGRFMARAKSVCKLLPEMHCLAVNKSGEPAHPLYQRASTVAVPYCRDQSLA